MIYFIRIGNNVKIGYTKCLSQRVGTLRTATPNDPVVLGVMPGTRQDERALHDAFKHLHVCREWFDLGDEIVAYIEANCRPYLLGIAREVGGCALAQSLKREINVYISAAIALALTGAAGRLLVEPGQPGLQLAISLVMLCGMGLVAKCFRFQADIGRIHSSQRDEAT